MTRELSKSFNPKEIEEKWYTYWESEGYYSIGNDLNNSKSFSQIPHFQRTRHKKFSSIFSPPGISYCWDLFIQAGENQFDFHESL